MEMKYLETRKRVVSFSSLSARLTLKGIEETKTGEVWHDGENYPFVHKSRGLFFKKEREFSVGSLCDFKGGGIYYGSNLKSVGSYEIRFRLTKYYSFEIAIRKRKFVFSGCNTTKPSKGSHKNIDVFINGSVFSMKSLSGEFFFSESTQSDFKESDQETIDSLDLKTENILFFGAVFYLTLGTGYPV